MKKRLLSAALALAMVLTLLPMSVLSASAATATAPTANYAAKDDGKHAGAPGYFYQTGTGSNITYTKITNGFVVGGKYYGNFPLNAATGKPLSTTFTVIGNVGSVNVGDATSVTVDVYGNKNTPGSIAISGSNLTQITVNDSKMQQEITQGVRKITERGSITLPEMAQDKAINIRLTDVEANNGVTFGAANVTRQITLRNAYIGEVTMNGVTTNAQGMIVQAAQNITAEGSGNVNTPYDNQIGTINVIGQSSRINLADTNITGNISLEGPSTSLTVSGNTKHSGTVTLTGVNSNPNANKTQAGPSVTVNGGQLGAIGGIGNAESLTSNFNITVGSAGSVTGINIPNAAVTVNGGTVGNGGIQITNGSVKIQNGATVGPIAFGSGGIITEFSVTGSNNTVGAVTTGSDTFTRVSIPADNTNSFASLALGNYAGHGVLGGKFTTPIAQDKERDYLGANLSFRVQLQNGGFAYYAKDKLSDAIAAAGTTNATSGSGIVLVGQRADKTLTLRNIATDVAKIGFNANSAIILPGIVNGVTYDNWTVTSASSTDPSGASYKPGQEFTVIAGNDYYLNAQVVDTSVSKIINATNSAPLKNGDIKVSMSGNAITLSGAASSSVGSIAVFEVELTTDISNEKGAVKVTVNVLWNGTRTYFDRNSNPGYGITFPDENTMRLDNGTTYTVNGSGLKELVNTFYVDETSKEIVANVTVPGYTTTAQKNELIRQLLGTDAYGKVASSFEWGRSPAMRQAVNAAMATITANQVETWKTQAQRQYWNMTHTGNPTTADLSGTGYDSVYLVPYLYVTITKTSPLTATLVPYYRVEVRGSGEPIVVKQGATLGTLLTDLTDGKDPTTTGVALTIAGNAVVNNQYYVHQDDTYVYRADGSKKIQVLHAGRTGLGTLVFSSNGPTVALTRTGNNGMKGTFYYDNLQAAVNDTLAQAQGYLDRITVYGNYTGSGAISVTGEARTFEIETQGNTVITASTSDTSVSNPASGHLYTIQLLRNNVTTTSIVVNSAANGVAAASAATAAPGSTITVTVRPNTGYQGSITVRTNTGATVAVTNNGNNTFSFQVPAGATRVEITPVFTLIGTGTGTGTGTYVPSGTVPFTDVPTTAPYYTAVEYCYSHNLIQGTTATSFAPNATITRHQIVTILWRQAGAPTQARQGLYKDMPGNSDYYNAVIWASKNGIAQGYEDGMFHGDRAINRQELATFLYRYQTNYLRGSATGSVSSLNGYADGYSTGSWAQAAMRWAVGNGIVTGTSTSLTPTSAAPRYQAATAMYQYCNGVLGIR